MAKTLITPGSFWKEGTSSSYPTLEFLHYGTRSHPASTSYGTFGTVGKACSHCKQYDPANQTEVRLSDIYTAAAAEAFEATHKAYSAAMGAYHEARRERTRTLGIDQLPWNDPAKSKLIKQLTDEEKSWVESMAMSMTKEANEIAYVALLEAIPNPTAKQLSTLEGYRTRLGK